MITLKNLSQTCMACPSQWEGTTQDDTPVYIRYRFGYLSVRVGVKDKDVWSAVNGEEIFGKQIGDEYDGVMDTEQMLQLIKEVLERS